MRGQFLGKQDAQRYMDTLDQKHQTIWQLAVSLRETSPDNQVAAQAAVHEADQLYQQGQRLGQTLNRYYPGTVEIPSRKPPVSLATASSNPLAETIDAISPTPDVLAQQLSAMREAYMVFFDLTQRLTRQYRRPLIPLWLRRAAAIAAAIALVYLVLFVAFPAARDYWHERQLRQAYEHGIVAYDDQNWAKAVKEFKYAYHEGPYEDSGYYLDNSYDQAARYEIGLENWDTARAYALEHIVLDYAGRVPGRAENNLHTAYFIPANECFDANDWSGTRQVLDELITAGISFEPEAEELYQKSYYAEADALSQFTSPDWAQIEKLLLMLLDRDAAPVASLASPVYELLASSYVTRAGLLMDDDTRADRWNAARAMLDPVLVAPLNTTRYISTAQTLYRDSYYQPATAAMAASDWQAALIHLEPLYELDKDFSDTSSLLARAYYNIGVEAYHAKNYSDAQYYLERTNTISANYADVPVILADTYYSHAQDVLAESPVDWTAARDLLNALLRLYPHYRDAETLLRDTYYVPALSTLTVGVNEADSATCQQARLMLLDLFALDPDFDPEADQLTDSQYATYKDALSLVHESYYCEATVALAISDLETALLPLQRLFNLSPYYKDAEVLYTQTLYGLGRAAFDAEDWPAARGYLDELHRIEPHYHDAFVLLREAYYVPAMMAFDASEWYTARTELRPLVIGDTDTPALDPNYKDARATYLETYYRRAEDAFDAGEWDTARTEARALIALVAQFDAVDLKTANYQLGDKWDSRTLLFEAYYQPGSAALTDGKWTTARVHFSELLDEVLPVYSDQTDYQDTRTLLFETYYHPGSVALEEQQWDTARTTFTSLLDIVITRTGATRAEVNYQDTRDLLREAYYRPGSAALENGQWQTARREFLGLLVLIEDWDGVVIAQANYQDAQDLLREAYYRPAMAAFDMQDWQRAREELFDLFDLIADIEQVESKDAQYKDAQEVLRRSYYVPGKMALEAQNWSVAREHFEPLVSAIDPDFEDARDLLVAAYRQPGEQALLNHDWGLARQSFDAILTLDSEDAEAATSLFTAYYEPGRQAFDEQDWGTARWHLGALAYRNMATPEVNVMLRETYIKPVETLIASGDMQAARQALISFDQQYPRQANVEDAETYERLLLATYSESFRETVALEDWYSAADLLLSENNPADNTVDRILLDKPELKREVIRRFATYWDAFAADLDVLPQTVILHSAAVNDFSVSFGSRVASGSTDGTIRIWDARNLESHAPLIIQTHTGWVYAVALSPDGRWVASTANDNQVYVWDADTGQLWYTLNGHTGWVSDVTFSADGQWLASASDDQTVRLWDTASWDTEASILTHTDRVTALAFSPDGAFLVSALVDGSLVIWDLSAQASTMIIGAADSFTGEIAFSPDSDLFATVGHDPAVRVWNTHGQLVHEWTEHNDWIRSASFSADGTLLVTVGADGFFYLWDMVSGNMLNGLSLSGAVPTRVQFSPENRHLLISFADGEFYIWSAQSDDR